jgi:hypothetical protein
MVMNITTKSKPQVNPLEEENNQLKERIKELEAQNYISNLKDDSVYRLELLRALDRISVSLDNLPQKVLELQNPTTQ